MPWLRLLSLFVTAAALAAQTTGPVTPPVPSRGPTAAPLDPFEALAALPLRESPARHVRVVVRDEKGEPANGALLVCVETTEPRYVANAADSSKQFPADEPGYWALRVANGARYAVDERGIARVPATTGRVLAWRGGIVATRAFSVEDGKSLPRVELTLKSPLTFRVQVVDAAGQPAANVMLGIVPTSSGPAMPKAPTDAQGCVVFRVLPTRTADARARVLAVTKERIEAPLPPDGGSAQLQLPACATVRVTFPGDLVPGTAITWHMIVNGRYFDPTEKEDRAAVFRFVEVGCEGTARATIHGTVIEAPVPPLTGGAEVAVALARGEQQRSVVVRVLDANGEPMASTHVDVHWSYEQGSVGTSARTTSEGWLEVFAPAVRGDLTLVLRIRTATRDSPLVGKIEVAVGKDDGQRVDRGEQRLTPIPMALAGTVVDGAGKPIRGVTLQVGPNRERATSGADGRFTVAMARKTPATLDVELASSGWYFTAPTSRRRTFDTGRDARLVLQPAGRVRFATTGLPNDYQCDFDTRVEPASGDGERIALDRLRGSELLLPAGHWHFVVTENNRELHRIENVRVDAGIEVHDPRFMTFDWQSFASLVTLRVEDPNGKPFDACTVWHQFGSRGSGIQPTNGTVRWLVAKDGGDLRVEPHDKSVATVQLGTITGEHVVRIGGGPKLVVQLTKPPELPEGAALVVFVEGDDHCLPFDAAGTLTMTLAEPGERRLSFGLRRGDTTELLQITTDTITVPAAGLTHRLDLVDRLQAAIDRLAK